MCVCGSRSGNEWFFLFFQMFIFILFFKLPYRYTGYIQHVPLILSTLIFLAPMVLLVPLSHRQFRFYVYAICIWAHMYTTQILVHMSLFIYGNSRHHEWDSQHGSKDVSCTINCESHSNKRTQRWKSSVQSWPKLFISHRLWGAKCWLGVL